MKRFFGSFFVIAAFCTQTFAQDYDLRILDQSGPKLPIGHCTLDVQGSVLSGVAVKANNEVGNVTPIIGSPASDLTSLAASTAKKIRIGSAVDVGDISDTSRIVSHSSSVSRNASPIPDDKAEEVIRNAVRWMGGDRFLKIKTQIGRGKFSVMKEGIIVSFRSFYDAIVFPDRERTEFKGQGSRLVQVNEGGAGWIFDAGEEIVKDQTPRQIESFIRGRRTSLENLLRGDWRGQAELSYVGRRPASLGKRNDVVKLTYEDGFEVEFEFAADDASPQKSLTRRRNSDDEEIVEEDRFARFIEINGIKAPMIIDKFINNRQVSRVGYDKIEFNTSVPDSLFRKPENAKAAKKGMRL